MLEDEVEQELRIMAERGQPVVDQSTFMRPIAELCRRPVTTVPLGTTVARTVEIMQEREIGAVAVVAHERLAGIFTERDVFRRALHQLPSIEQRAVSEFMTPNPTSLRKDDTIVALMNKMHMGQYRHVPIVDQQDRPLHMVSIRDLLHFFFEHFPPQLINVSEPFRGQAQQYSG